MYTLSPCGGGASGDVQKAPLFVWNLMFRRSHSLLVFPVQLPSIGSSSTFTTRTDFTFSQGNPLVLLPTTLYCK